MLEPEANKATEPTKRKRGRPRKQAEPVAQATPEDLPDTAGASIFTKQRNRVRDLVNKMPETEDNLSYLQYIERLLKDRSHA